MQRANLVAGWIAQIGQVKFTGHAFTHTGGLFACATTIGQSGCMPGIGGCRVRGREANSTAEAILDYLKEAAEEQVILQAISLKSALEKSQHCDQTLAYTCTGFRPLAINFWNLTGNHR